MVSYNRPFRLVHDLVDDVVTLILYQEGRRVMAEVIGPRGGEDIVLSMPEAVGSACERAGASHEVVVLDDEKLWQPGWGRLLTPGHQQRDSASGTGPGGSSPPSSTFPFH